MYGLLLGSLGHRRLLSAIGLAEFKAKTEHKMLAQMRKRRHGATRNQAIVIAKGIVLRWLQVWRICDEGAAGLQSQVYLLTVAHPTLLPTAQTISCHPDFRCVTLSRPVILWLCPPGLRHSLTMPTPQPESQPTPQPTPQPTTRPTARPAHQHTTQLLQ